MNSVLCIQAAPLRAEGLTAVELLAMHLHPASTHCVAAVRSITIALQDDSVTAAILGNV